MAGNNIRFTTAMDDGRPIKDPSATDEGQPGLSGGFYDNSDAKLANKTEDHRLTLAIEGISLEQYRSVADIEDDKKQVKKGFHNLLSQRQLLDVARADRIVGPGRSSTGDRGAEVLMRRYRPQSSQNLLSSSPRQLFQLTPSMPHLSSKKRDTNKQTIDHNGNHGNQSPTPYSVHRRPHTGFHAVRPFTSGGRRRTGTPQSPRGGRNAQGAESVPEGGDATSMSSNKKTATRAKTAIGVRQNQMKPVQSSSGTNQGQDSEGQPKTNRNSVDTDDTDTDDDTVKGASRPRSKSAFGIDQISIPSYPIEEDMMNVHLFTGPTLTSRRYSGSMQGRPQTASAAVLHGRSRRELSRLTHIDAITASEMALRRKMWLARQDVKNTVGEAALQQRIQEFITKLDTDKRKREEQHLMMFENEDKREDLVLPAV